MQNSGLGQSINALASLALLYKIPLLLVISWRGYLGKDEPEHLYMGRYTLDFLSTLKIPFEIAEKGSVEEQITKLVRIMKTEKLPVALVLKKDVIK